MDQEAVSEDLNPLNSTIKQFVKYAVSGVVNTSISYLVFAILVHLSVYSAVSLAVAYICGMTTSYVLNASWTFQRNVFEWSYAWRFLIVNLAVLAVSECSLWLILKVVISSDYLGQAINLLPTVILGFFANRLLVFRHY